MSHEQYQKFVRDRLVELFIKKEIASIVRFAPYISRLFQFDLDPLTTMLELTYNKPHNNPRDPVTLMRSLLLMTLTKETSITNWVQKLHDSKVYAILSGFEPGDVPGVGTFYGFIDRLTNADKAQKRKLKNKLKEFRRKPSKKLKKNQKLPPKHPGIVAKIVNRILNNMNKSPVVGKHEILYQFFIQCVLENSAQRGLLGDPENLSIAGDGTHIKTGASPYGVKVCDCPKFVVKNGKKVFYRCTCKRRFSDFYANWGWDSYREHYVYGYSFYELNCADSPFDLPLFFIQTQASRHDSVSAPVTFDLAVKMLPDYFHINEFLADGAHDNNPLYKMMQKFDCEPIIPLNEGNTGNFVYKKCQVNENGIPCCSTGEPMVYWGYCADRMRLKWRCPLKASKNFCEKPECKQNNYCSDSEYGRVVYTYPKDNCRIFTKTPRGSEEWLKKYDKRSSAERSNKRKKIDFRLQQARVRSREQWFVRYTLAAICQHLDAWATATCIDFKELCKSWQDGAIVK